jgi:hypothetical protein
MKALNVIAFSNRVAGALGGFARLVRRECLSECVHALRIVLRALCIGVLMDIETAMETKKSGTSR